MSRDHDHYGAPKKATDLGPLFGGEPAAEPVTPPTPAEDRATKVRLLHDAGSRRWIDAGRPIALLVAAQDGRVTAETFREAAAKLHALPPAYEDQRALSWIPTMFAELCREGRLRKQRHPNGAPVKVYSKAQGNDQVVYELVSEQERAS